MPSRARFLPRSGALNPGSEPHQEIVASATADKFAQSSLTRRDPTNVFIPALKGQ